MKSLVNAVRAKRTRTCDNCEKNPAQWFCAADDAFLCQSCDTSVHSANALARRHKRVRSKSAIPAAASKDSNQNHSASSPMQEAATWHHGFTRKPRTPRGSGKKNNLSTFHGLVPEISAGDQTDRDNSEVGKQLIFQVPVLDPMGVETKIEFRPSGVMMDDQEDKDNADESYLNGFLPTDMELEEFAADVEILLGGGLETDSCTMENDDDDQDDRDGTMPFELNFDLESHNTLEEEAIKNVESVKGKEEEKKNARMLQLNNDQVNQLISTWGGQRLSWTSGEPPELDINISGSPVVSMGKNGGESHEKKDVGGSVPSSGVGDGGREAKVSRYREKKKTRSFSKKIRYEVRKVHAEKRPRLKGRFVKSASLAASAGNSPLV